MNGMMRMHDVSEYVVYCMLIIMVELVIILAVDGFLSLFLKVDVPFEAK